MLKNIDIASRKVKSKSASAKIVGPKFSLQSLKYQYDTISIDFQSDALEIVDSINVLKIFM